jgi:acetyltransferase
MSRSPAALAGVLRLADGTQVTLRPIRPEDAGLEQDFIAGLSPETVRLRFMGGLRSLTPSMLARFTQIDFDRDMALVAMHDGEGRELEVAVCRYITLPDGVSCEFAIVVADAWQGRGLGRQMMSRLTEVARERGLARIMGFVLSANAGMLALCRSLGFAIEVDRDDASLCIAELELGQGSRIGIPAAALEL